MSKHTVKHIFRGVVFLLIVVLSSQINAQDGFRFINQNKNYERVKFKLINNLIVVPLEINGKELSFILDTGVSKIILFNITQNDSIGLNNVEKVSLQGLGKGEPVDALLSKHNRLKVENLVSNNETIYIIVRDYFDLSSKMGTTIHGVLGYDLLSNFVVKINYRKKYIDFYRPETFEKKKCRRCETFPIQFYRRKPFIDAKVQLDTIGNTLTDVKLLIDSGGSDALWMFEHTKPEIITPKNYFKDILGEGLSGAIYGNRSRVKKFKLGKFDIENPTVSFLDSVSTKNARGLKERNGSIGADILRRFIVWFDYRNKEVTLKKNGSLTKGFNYNMSGLEVVYNGKQLVREKDERLIIDGYQQQGLKSSKSIDFIISYSYRFKPSYRIKNVLENSPAALAGLKKDDIILKINNTAAHNLKLSDINYKFQEKDGGKMRLTVSRNGQIMKFKFKLEKKI